jgi:hypothetical protein
MSGSSCSAEHARDFQAELLAVGIDAACFTARSADYPLKQAAAGSVVVTADSAILDTLAQRRMVEPPERLWAYDGAYSSLVFEFGEISFFNIRTYAKG